MKALPCPHCGNTNYIIKPAARCRTAVVECLDCGAQGPEIHYRLQDKTHSLEDRAIEEWNRRFELEPVSRVHNESHSSTPTHKNWKP